MTVLNACGPWSWIGFEVLRQEPGSQVVIYLFRVVTMWLRMEVFSLNFEVKWMILRWLWEANLSGISIAWDQSNLNCKILGCLHKRSTPVGFLKDEPHETIT